METQQVVTRLDWRIAQQEPDFDLETDLYTCTASDGTTIYAPSAEEANRERNRYECKRERSMEDLCFWLYSLSGEWPSKWFDGGKPRLHAINYDFLIACNPASGLWHVARRIR